MQKLAGFAFLRHFIDESPAYNPVPERYSLLLNLPPELRLTIYEYVLRFPTSGIRMVLHPFTTRQAHGSNPSVTTMTRNMGEPIGAKDWDEWPVARSDPHARPYLLRAAPIHQILALLLVNRGMRELRDFLAHIHPLRLRYVRHVSLLYRNRIFDKLLNVTGLRELRLHINEEALAAMQRRDGTPRFKTARFPGLTSLADAENLEVKGRLVYADGERAVLKEKEE
ncbi:hypothetical protein B0A55_04829 [Friedmanniomyces simplex]|uniref:Uncharacterized protein n=1 Tax=Friedmanniomyces simplex TaxID=329884 RepID=A0A4U0X918_9PEZI|nr:hypothetical protein B0A55_04829 [Friedmanniomyces simplex]